MKRWRILLGYDTTGWCYHRRCQSLQKYAPDDFTVDIAPAINPAFAVSQHYDLVLQLCYGRTTETRVFLLEHGYPTVLVVGFNVGWNEDAALRMNVLPWMADHVVINSRLSWEAAGRPSHTSWISNGVDRDHYQLRVPIERRPRKVLWTGSMFHRATGAKNFDTLLRPIKTHLETQYGIECDFRLVDSHGGPSRWSTSRMCEWYNTGAVYLCASRREGTPNPALEAASCGCTVVSTPVGNMPELIEDKANGCLCDFTMRSLIDGVLYAVKHYERLASAMQQTIAEWDWSKRAAAYYDLFRRLLENPRARQQEVAEQKP